MRVGITGHQRLQDAAAWPWVQGEISRLLSGLPRPLVGLSSLAVGADQMFASLILEHRGELEAVLPFPGYRARYSASDVAQYDALLARATRVETLPARGTDQDAYLAAGLWIVDRSDVMVAVWNGKPAVDVGGTADVVDYARSVGRPLTILNPIDRRVF